MNEELLQFLWKFQLFNFLNCTSVEGKKVEIIKVGKWNTDQGPDFLNAQLKYDGLTWTGPIELHLRSSDWELHKHSESVHYQNIIAHVVYENDREIPYIQKKGIPTIELKSHISKKHIERYQNMQYSSHPIPCEESIGEVKENIPFEMIYVNWILEKWQTSQRAILETYELMNQNWEATLWVRMAYTFGLKINASIFEQMAMDIPFLVIQKISRNEEDLLALLHGKAGLLASPKDDFQQLMADNYGYICHKFSLGKRAFYPKFLRLRPSSFPTIQLAQLANLYHHFPNLFSEMLKVKKGKDAQQLFQNIKANAYFEDHYVYGKTSTKRVKKISKQKINSLMINAILPVQFTYYQYLGKDTQPLIEMLQDLSKENNSIVNRFQSIGFLHENALHSQALIQQFKSKCSKKKCLLCSIGLQIVKNDS